MSEDSNQKLRVTVFGGSKPVPGDPEYEDAVKLGNYLGASGFVLLTGGYIGTMEAVSRGAALAGGHVVGVTCDQIETWRPVAPNKWVMEEIRYSTIRERLYALIDGCDVAIALPGGIGTLAEVAVMWSQLQTGASLPRPIILVGKGWETSMRSFFDEFGKYIPMKDLDWLHFTWSIDTAFKLLKTLILKQ